MKVKVLENGYTVQEIKGNECNYKEHDGQLKEQFINGLNDEMMAAEIIKT